jgi:hypothetical protein
MCYLKFSGLPKGAMLTHKGTISTVVSAFTLLVSFETIGSVVFINFCYKVLMSISIPNME